MTTKYHCPHLSTPHHPLPSSYPSSSSSFSPLNNLYFCEECDAIRCDQCVAIEIASYFCPNCLFDVPSANVRADKNRCARSCFACPCCSSSLGIVQTDASSSTAAASVDTSSSDPPKGTTAYILSCPGCKWTSREIGWEFEKPTGLALQAQKLYTAPDKVQSEFDAIKDHLEAYIASPTKTAQTPKYSASRNPSRHIAHLTQMASKALQRDVPSLAAHSARYRQRVKGHVGEREKLGWDEVAEYTTEESWRSTERNTIGRSPADEEKEEEETAQLEKRWTNSWGGNRPLKSMVPQRIALQPKLTKRCPQATCRHLLIQPDTKSVRMKIKMVASDYLPVVEVGRRRRRMMSQDHLVANVTAEEEERLRTQRRRTMGVQEIDEDLTKQLVPGETYTFQLAFTNPLYDPIQIRLSQASSKPESSSHKHNIHIPVPHFTISALKDAWAYEDEEDDVEGDGEDLPSVSGEGTATGTSTGEDGSLSRRGMRKSMLGGTVSSGGSGSGRSTKARETGLTEKRGNVTKVPIDILVGSPLSRDAEAGGRVRARENDRVNFDLEVRYTYRADEGGGGEKDKVGKGEKKEEEYKTFVFWVRVDVGSMSIP